MGHYERLSALDQSFLDWETPTNHMHVASTMVFEGTPLRTADGGVDLARIKKAVLACLPRIPRYRQKLMWTPITGRAVWVDDAEFDLDYHVRHLALPRPGSERQLKDLSALIMQQPLDRSRPLWELWVVEGVEGERFALVSKVHHCMIDGIAGVDLMMMLLSPTPDAPLEEAPLPPPRPAPSAAELLAAEALRRARLPLDAARNFGVLRREALDLAGDAATRLRAATKILARALRPASRTPMNGTLGPHRRFDWWVTDLSRVKRVSRALGGTVNDVVLTTVSGAVRRWLERRGCDPRSIHFRVMAPVSMRSPDERGVLGNRISLWLIDLPLHEKDPRRALRAIHQQTASLKQSREALGAELLTQVAEWTSSTLLSVGTRAATRLLPFNLVVTNVPGPQIPLYFLESRLLEAYPVAPLIENQGLSVALLSYDGSICWGFNADYDLLRDLDVFVEDVRRAFQEVEQAASEGPRARRRARNRQKAASPSETNPVS